MSGSGILTSYAPAESGIPTLSPPHRPPRLRPAAAPPPTAAPPRLCPNAVAHATVEVGLWLAPHVFLHVLTRAPWLGGIPLAGGNYTPSAALGIYLAQCCFYGSVVYLLTRGPMVSHPRMGGFHARIRGTGFHIFGDRASCVECARVLGSPGRRSTASGRE